ncbi:MAG: heme o synthase [Halobacteriaceae archaeon]
MSGHVTQFAPTLPRWSPTAWLAGATMGTYLLVAAGTVTALAPAHLALGALVFAALLVALARRLESETAGTEPDRDAATDRDPAPAPAETAPDGPLGVARAYVELTKPKLAWLLCLVALASMALVPGPSLDPRTAIPTLAGGVLAVGASGTFNSVLERDVDRRMERTADRPLPTDRVPVRNALAFGAALTLASAATFVAFVNALAAALALCAILFYSVVYTLVLKPNTTRNVVLGGAVGAFPALIGWAAVTGSVGLPAIALGAVVFLWTPAHFYNLALAYEDDYANGGVPMLPVVRGESTARKHVLLYLGATLLGAVALGAVTSLGWLYAATTVVVGGGFLWAVVRLHRERTDGAAFRAFHASNAYLGSLLLAIVVDAGVL